MLSYWERKRGLPHGASRTIAQLLGCTESMVSMVLKGVRRDRAIERALAAKMKPRVSVGVAFGPAAPVRMRQARKAA
jgi:hypothetical protein